MTPARKARLERAAVAILASMAARRIDPDANGYDRAVDVATALAAKVVDRIDSLACAKPRRRSS